MTGPRTVRRLSYLLLLLTACADSASSLQPGGDLPLGDEPEDMKSDGDWGAALDCKAIPSLPPLANPKITISIDGLTLHLTDAASGYDKVFPIGIGKVDETETDSAYRESLSYGAIIRAGGGDFTINWEASTPCKTWWTDPETGDKSPVFAGLPFMSFFGNYAIHGPIDKFRAPNGGTLRRGYVSHGCSRMEAADVLEVYALIKDAPNVPVHLQREAERTRDGKKVDVASKWVGAECNTNAECGYANGFCARNALSGRGFCSARCTQYCQDRPGNPSTFCVADPASPSQGMCVPKVQSENFECRPYDHLGAMTLPRLGHPETTATVCMPASRGWVGDRCLGDGDCTNGTTCKGAALGKAGVCSMSCDRYCGDQPGAPDTFCAGLPQLGAGGSCVRRCTPNSNAAECPADSTCQAVARNGDFSTVRNVCVPR